MNSDRQLDGTSEFKREQRRRAEELARCPHMHEELKYITAPEALARKAWAVAAHQLAEERQREARHELARQRIAATFDRLERGEKLEPEPEPDDLFGSES
jgi:hypothetical protein